MNFDNYTIRLLTQEDLKAYWKLIDNNRKRLGKDSLRRNNL